MANTILLSIAVISAILLMTTIIIIDKTLGKDYDTDNEWILPSHINADRFKAGNVNRTSAGWDFYKVPNKSVSDV